MKRLKSDCSLRIESFKYKELKLLFHSKYKGDFSSHLNYDQWNWNISDNYFLPFASQDVENLKQGDLHFNDDEQLEEMISKL